MEQQQKPRERSFIAELVPDGRPTRVQVLWAVRIAILLSIVVLIGYAFDITLWDWLKLLVIPTVLAAGGYLFNRALSERQQRFEDQRAWGQAQDTALQSYLEQIGRYLLDEDLRDPPTDSEVRRLALARTRSILFTLDAARKRLLLYFLHSSGLITTERGEPVISLYGADLSGVDMRDALVMYADFAGAQFQGADLSRAHFSALLLSPDKEAEAARMNIDDPMILGRLSWRHKLSGS